MPRLGATEYQEKVESLKASGLPVLTVPTYAELVSGSAKMGQVRDLSISDILGRTEVPANPDLLGQCVTGKNVLVTGGGGSIGSELSRQIVLQNPNKLIILDQSEFNLYQITEEITSLLASKDDAAVTFLPVLGSVTDVEQVSSLLDKENVNTVYHAAAYKHVPVIEAQPDQGLDTNVFGTLNVVNAAIAKGVDNFVLISTDKAVRPTNSMGASNQNIDGAFWQRAGLIGLRCTQVQTANRAGRAYNPHRSQHYPILYDHPRSRTVGFTGKCHSRGWRCVCSGYG